MYLRNPFVIGHTPTEILGMKSGGGGGGEGGLVGPFGKKTLLFLSLLGLLRYEIISDFLLGKKVTTLKTYSSLLKEGNLSIYSSLQRRILNLKELYQVYEN